jgi:hypothetical protein
MSTKHELDILVQMSKLLEQLKICVETNEVFRNERSVFEHLLAVLKHDMNGLVMRIDTEPADVTPSHKPIPPITEIEIALATSIFGTKICQSVLSYLDPTKPIYIPRDLRKNFYHLISGFSKIYGYMDGVDREDFDDFLFIINPDNLIIRTYIEMDEQVTLKTIIDGITKVEVLRQRHLDETETSLYDVISNFLQTKKIRKEELIRSVASRLVTIDNYGIRFTKVAQDSLHAAGLTGYSICTDNGIYINMYTDTGKSYNLQVAIQEISKSPLDYSIDIKEIDGLGKYIDK